MSFTASCCITVNWSIIKFLLIIWAQFFVTEKGSCIWWNTMTRLVADKTMTSQLKPSGQVTYHEYFFEASSISHIILLFNDFSTYSTIKYPATGTVHASVQRMNLSSFCVLVSLARNDSKLMLLFLELRSVSFYLVVFGVKHQLSGLLHCMVP